MKQKYTKLLLSFVFLIFIFSTNANNLDYNLNVAPKSSTTLTIDAVTGNAGANISVPVNTTGITDLAGFQWTVEYDATKLTYVDCNNWNTVTGVLINSGTVGKLTFVWAEATGSNIPAGKFFDINFTIKSGATGVANLIWSDDPTARELNDAVPLVITTTWNNGSVTINSSSNPTLTIEDVNGIDGNAVVVPVNAKDINDLVGFQFTIDYDETKLTYTGVSNWDAGVTGTPTINDDGSVLTFAYNDYPNAINIADGKFFDLNFDIIGGATGVAPVIWSDTPTLRELSNSVPEVITASWVDGSVTITAASSPIMTIQDVSGVAGTAVVVPVDAFNLIDLVGFQFTIDYDETKLTYTGVSNWDAGVTGTPTINDDGSVLTFAYNDYPNAINIADGKFFDLNFNIIGGATGVAPVIWSDTPTLKELSNSVPAVITATWEDGSVTITTATNPTLTIDEVAGIAGSPVAVPVNVTDLSDLIGFQWTIDYDETKLSYVNCSNWDAQVTGTVTINDDGDVLTFAYNDYPNAINIANGKFFDINFNVLLGATGVADVVWSDSPTARELSNSVPATITGIWVDGRVILDISWDGSTSTDWQDETNWTPEFIPEALNNIIIPNGMPNYPIVDDGLTTAVCNNMTIEANASVTIAVNGQMTTSGTITNNRGVQGLIILSNATGDGSLIINNSGVDATVERYLPNVIAETGQWHFLGSPITTAPVSLFNTNNFFEYDETTDDWWDATITYGTTGWGVPSGNLVIGKGYAYYFNEATVSYEGTLNYEPTEFSMPTTYTEHTGTTPPVNLSYTNFDGWNLVANPTTSALDWTQMNLSNVDNTVYYYDDISNNYKYYTAGGSTYDIGITVNGGSQIIPSGQGFFVKTSSNAPGTFTIPKAARVHNPQLFWKVAKETPNNFIRFKVENSNFYDETVLRTLPDAQTSFDGDFDAYKRFSWNSEVPQIFTYDNVDKIKYAINTTNINDASIVPLGYYFKNDGEYTINITEINFDDYNVYLVDKQKGTEIDIKVNPSYTFTTVAGIITDRLEIRFEKTVSIDGLSDDIIKIYPNPASDKLTILGINSNVISNIKIYSVTGKLIKATIPNTINEININSLKEGIYFIEINSKKGKIIKKFVKE